MLGLSDLAFNDINARFKVEKNNFDELRFKGPIKVDYQSDQEINLNRSEKILFDYAKPLNDEPSPIVIFHHGNKFIKEAHKNHIKRLASWGIHAISVQSKNQHNWQNNGRRLHYLVNLLKNSPDLISPNITPSQIILAGHSFGGSAVTMAASLNKNVKGIILLDPAVVAENIIFHQRNLKIPAILLGADEKVFLSRKRKSFRQNIKNLVYEVSVEGATHNAAQSPTITEHIWGFDPTTSTTNIFTFTHLITAATFALVDGDHLENFGFLIERLKHYGRLSKALSKSYVDNIDDLEELSILETNDFLH